MSPFYLTEDYELEFTTPTVTAIPEFKAMLALKYNSAKNDVRGQKRYRAKKEMLFIYFMHDYKSEFSILPEEERRVQAFEAAELPGDYAFSGTMLAAIDRYNEVQQTRSIKLLNAANKSIDVLIEYFNDAKKEDAEGILKNIGILGRTIEGLDKLENQVKKAMGPQSRIRGDQEGGRL